MDYRRSEGFQMPQKTLFVKAGFLVMCFEYKYIGVLRIQAMPR
jgi:hypothetical protein